MTERAPTPEEIAKLLEGIERLRREAEERERKIAEQAQEIEDLKRQLGDAQRAGKRQARPFARRKRVKQSKKPGRAAGHEGARGIRCQTLSAAAGSGVRPFR